MKLKTMISAVLCAALLLCATACDALPSQLQSVVDQNKPASSAAVPDASSAEDSRSTGEFYEGEMGEVLENTFFSFCVNNAELAFEYEGVQSADGMQFVIIDLTVQNLLNGDTPMYDTDFFIEWGNGDEEAAYPEVILNSAATLPETYTLAAGENITGKLVFSVPAECTRFYLSYVEIYEDEYQGDWYSIYIELGDTSISKL